jgi:hypothetical protein
MQGMVPIGARLFKQCMITDSTPPTADDSEPLNPVRRAIGWLALLIPILLPLTHRHHAGMAVRGVGIQNKG